MSDTITPAPPDLTRHPRYKIRTGTIQQSGERRPSHARELVERLRHTWDTRPDLSSLDIAYAFGMTKSQIIGIAHRNKFKPRPSPIAAGSVSRGKSPGPPLEGAAGLAAAQAVTARILVERTQIRMEAVMVEKPTPKPVPMPPVVLAPSYHKQCQWLCGPDTGKPGRHLPMCDAPTVAGTSYCLTHWRQAHDSARPKAWL